MMQCINYCYHFGFKKGEYLAILVGTGWVEANWSAIADRYMSELMDKIAEPSAGRWLVRGEAHGEHSQLPPPLRQHP